MAIQQQQQQFTRNNQNSYPLGMIKGRGESGFSTDVTGILDYLEPRSDTYTYTTPEGEVITRPQSWIAHFSDGQLFSWSTYEDENHEVKPWDRFDPSIDLEYCRQNGIKIRVWRDKRKFMHLCLAEESNTSVQMMVQQPQMQPQMQQQYYQPQMQQPQQMQQQWRQPNQNVNGAPF